MNSAFARFAMECFCPSGRTGLAGTPYKLYEKDVYIDRTLAIFEISKRVSGARGPAFDFSSSSPTG
jgi:hypothetical protein